tara:strand:- start:267 stop:740 length:474 start_codon:yes stop_codon:yes gene_type:complete
MDVQIFVLSTMSPELTHTYFRTSHIDIDIDTPTIQRVRWPRADGALSVSLWVASQHPIVDNLAAMLLPYMDACVCLYHDHSAMSCIRVRKAMDTLQKFSDEIWLQSTVTPPIRMRHESRIRKFYTKHGFERPQRNGKLKDTIEEILRVDLNIFKYLS